MRDRGCVQMFYNDNSADKSTSEKNGNLFFQKKTRYKKTDKRNDAACPMCMDAKKEREQQVIKNKYKYDKMRWKQPNQDAEGDGDGLASLSVVVKRKGVTKDRSCHDSGKDRGECVRERRTECHGESSFSDIFSMETPCHLRSRKSPKRILPKR